jgi:hypothetical protein
VGIVYVASSPRHDGWVKHRGRSLARHLSTQHNLQVYGAIFQPDAPVFQGRVRD